MASLPSIFTPSIKLFETSRRELAAKLRGVDPANSFVAMAEEKKETTHPQLGGPAPSLPRFHGHIPGSNSARRTWTDLVGLTAEEAEKKIKEDMPGAQIQVVKPDSCVTMDFRTNRVRLCVDSLGQVAKAPQIG